MKRRSFLRGACIGSMLSFLASSKLNAALSDSKKLLGFKAVKANTKDIVSVPEGYEARVLISWGDPLFKNASAYDEAKNIDAKAVENAALSFGDNTDGMSIFTLSKTRAILAVNNEYINPEIMFNHQGKKLSKEDVLYEQNSVGVSIFEIEKKGDFYSVVLDSKYNRRITAHSKIAVSGDAKKAVLGEDSFVYGTLNNCANGQTPWGTYLTCEENVDDFFGSLSSDFKANKSLKRYGFDKKSVYGWEKFDERFDLAKNPKEANKFGWVVEIDPFNKDSIPVKRTSLGRFKHENAELVVDKDGSVAVYMGDDEIDEFLYKFVSKHNYKKGEKNDKILDEGSLYVAKFHGEANDFKGVGEWIELKFGKNNLNESTGFHSQADVLINARLAGSVVGATPMDRCEWVAHNEKSNELFVSLTNNKNRKEANAANPRAKNIYGHIIKFWHKNSHKDTKFSWEVFALAGEPEKQKGLKKGSNNITAQNKFNSPDGLKFDKYGRLWIQTDGNYSDEGDFEGMGNNCMLAADPRSGEIKRFLVGPVACEITGLAFNDDNTIAFVGIQHPGERLNKSNFPYGKTPRSSIVMIRKLDGGVIGT